MASNSQSDIHSDNIPDENPLLALITLLNKNCITVKIGKTVLDALVDTGATVSVVSYAFLQEIFKNVQIKTDPKNLGLKSACGNYLNKVGISTISVDINGLIIQHDFHVIEYLQQKVILGLDFLKQNNAHIDFEHNTLSLLDDMVQIQMLNVVHENDTFNTVKSYEDVTLDPHTETNILVHLNDNTLNEILLFEPDMANQSHYLVGSKCIVNVNNGHGTYRILNTSSEKVQIKKNSIVAKSTNIDEKHIYSLDENTSSNNVNCSAQEILDLGVNINDNLTKSQETKLLSLLAQNRQVFAKDMSELGCTDIHHHDIETGDNPPVRCAPYRANPQQRELIDTHIDEMLKHGIIEESNSTYQSPVVLVKKKNGQYRFCVDYRKLNKQTTAMSFPIPRVDDVFDTVAHSKASVFSVLDAASGFWQVPLSEKTKHKSAFVTHRGLYNFRRLAFGMMNAPMTYQMLMTKVLKELNWKVALIYIDDLLIYSQNFDEHLKH